MSMPEEDPRRMEGIRKYAAIYGRFDCKRKPEKPLTLHEVNWKKYIKFIILNIDQKAKNISIFSSVCLVQCLLYQNYAINNS